MKHLYPRNRVKHPHRKRTAAQRAARIDYGLPLPVQPRRPLKLLPPDHPLHGKVPIITGALLRADPVLNHAYVWWSACQTNRWRADNSISIGRMARSWCAWVHN